MVLLADGGIEGLRCIYIVADGENEIGIPAMDERRDGFLAGKIGIAKVAENREAEQGLWPRRRNDADVVGLGGRAAVGRGCGDVEGERRLGLGVERAGGRARDDAGAGVDGEARVIEAVGDRRAGIGIAGRGGDADGRAGGGVLGDPVGGRVGVRLGVEGDRLGAVEDAEGEALVGHTPVRRGGRHRQVDRRLGLEIERADARAGDDAGAGVDDKALIIEAVGDRRAGIRVAGRSGDPDRRAGSGEFGDLVGGGVGIGRHIEGHWRTDRTGRQEFDVEQRRPSGKFFERCGGARAGAGDDEGHVVECRPARAADDFLDDRRQVRRALGEAGLARRGPRRCRPGRRRVRPGARRHVEAGRGEGIGVVGLLSSDQQRRRAGLRLVGAELDVGIGDDSPLGDVDAGEAEPDRVGRRAVKAQLQIVDVA